MSALQYLRWRLGTYRAAIGTIRHIRSTKMFPQSLVDAGAIGWLAGGMPKK